MENTIIPKCHPHCLIMGKVLLKKLVYQWEGFEANCTPEHDKTAVGRISAALRVTSRSLSQAKAR